MWLKPPLKLGPAASTSLRLPRGRVRHIYRPPIRRVKRRLPFSRRVPPVEEMEALLRKALAHIPAERLWVNPDCGLKTRGWAEVEAALANLVAAARRVRAALARAAS